MKTTIKSIIVSCAMGIVGLTTANAAANCEIKDSKLISANQTLAMLNDNMALPEAELNGSVDYQKEAQLVTRWYADRAEAQATRQIMGRNEASVGEAINISIDETIDFRKDAQLETKAIADKEEAVTVQKLVDEGRIAENR